METYGKILLIAMPAFLVLVLFEKWWGWRKGFNTVNNMDMISSLSSGITNVTKDVLGLSISIISYDWLFQHVAVFSIPSTVLVYGIAFVSLDFMGYWIHRIDHTFNFFWNAHIIHHSSEEYNLACALRQSISSFVRVFTIFLLPAAILGVPTQVIALVAPLHLFAQFWYHTRHINKMGFLEKIIVTPSHHRVHHAINKEYIDKNYGQIFIIWDHLFGTFQEELAAVPAVYGITRPAQTWNPIKINFMHLRLLIADAWHTKQWKDKLSIWLKPTGWRPSDVNEKYPISKIEDVYHFEKYTTHTTQAFSRWIWFQMVVLLFIISYLFGNIASIGSPGIFWYGLYIFIFVYALTDLMDRNATSFYWEITKALLALGVLVVLGDWFGLNQWTPIGNYLMGAYTLLSLLGSIYFRKDVYTSSPSKS